MQTNIIVHAPARLDGINSDDFAVFEQNLIESGARRIILDVGALDYMSSAGVRAMFMIHQGITAKEGKLALLSIRPPVREVLRICGVEKLAPQAESIEAARRHVE